LTAKKHDGNIPKWDSPGSDCVTADLRASTRSTPNVLNLVGGRPDMCTAAREDIDVSAEGAEAAATILDYTR
jgi:hypothetical protein